MNHFRTIALVFALLFVVVANAQARASDFEVRTLAGESVPISQYFEPGKWTMVMLWTTYCGTCRSQYPTVSEFHDKHKDSDAKVIGISLDGFAEVEKVGAYIDKQPMTFDSAIVEVLDFQLAYAELTEEAFTGTPTYLMFNPAGDLVAHVPGLISVADVEQFIAANSD